jgi:hypothetical protein
MDNKLKIHSIIFNTISKVVFKVKELPEYNSLRLKASVTHFVAGLVYGYINESSLTNKEKKGIDQIKIIIQILDDVFALNEVEKGVIIDHVEHDADNKLVKKSNFKKGLGLMGSVLTFLSKK